MDLLKHMNIWIGDMKNAFKFMMFMIYEFMRFMTSQNEFILSLTVEAYCKLKFLLTRYRYYIDKFFDELYIVENKCKNSITNHINTEYNSDSHQFVIARKQRSANFNLK